MSMEHPSQHIRRGFTLLELAVVIVIISIITGMSIQSGVSVIATARQTATQKKIQAINDALLQYATANRRLPCPANLGLAPGNTNFGVMAANPGACTGGSPAANFSGNGITNSLYKAAEGAIPTTTLGIPQDFMYDGWGNKFRYAVDANMTLANAFNTVPVGCTAGAITVNDANGNARTTGAVYALISHGANGHGAYSRNGVIVNAGSSNLNELTNCHCNVMGGAQTYSPLYVQMDTYVDPNNAVDNYDDIVSYKDRWQMQTASDKAGNCTYLYVTDKGNGRAEKFDVYGNYLSSLGSSGSGLGNLKNPRGIAIDASGNIWVADAGNSRIEIFYTSGIVYAFGINGTNSGQFASNSPGQIAFDSTGNLWAVDTGNSRLQKFDKNGNYITQFGVPGSANGQLAAAPAGPQGIAIDSSGNLWVVDTGNTRVQEFSNVGTYLNQFGTAGNTSGFFTTPTTISIDSSGNLWVTDTSNNSVQEFNTSGLYIAGFGVNGSAAGTFGSNSPQSLGFDIYGNMWLSDTGNNRMEEFNNSGVFAGTFGTSGSANGQFSSPWGVAVTAR